MKTELAALIAFATNNGSEIHEPMPPSAHAVRHQSLAVAHPGQTMRRYRHWRSEGLYHIPDRSGRQTLATEPFEVSPGETAIKPSLMRGPCLDPLGGTVGIPPGSPHCIEDTGSEQRWVLCA